MDLGLKDKVAVVTGAASGIGAEVSRQLCAEGARVVVADINAEAAEAFAASLRATGVQAEASAVDVTDEDSVAQMMALAQSRFGGLDILVNNAGFTRDMRITKMGMNDWDAVINVVLKGAFLCTRASIPMMQAKGSGRIINMSSRAHLGNVGQANYSAAKAGLIGFTKAMALENGRYSITVNAIAPGLIGTEMVKSLLHFEKIDTAAKGNTPLGRMGEPEDVAAAVVFLASRQACYITGEVIHVTGGRY